METSIVKNVTQVGEWNGMNKQKVTLANGKELTFLSKGDFKAAIGDNINYEITNAQYSTAKLLGKADVPGSKPAGNSDVQLSIMRQTCIKASAEFNAQRSVGIEDVISDAEIMLNWILS